MESTHQTGHFDIYVMAAGCELVIPVSTSVWEGVGDRSGYVLRCYGNLVWDGFRILFVIRAGMH